MQLEFLADRDIGRRVVTALRGAGETVHTLADVYGEKESQLTADVDWLKLAGQRRWPALTKNKNIRYDSEERETVGRYDVWLFALANGNLGFAEMAGAFLTAMPAIYVACREHSGGAIWIIQRDGRMALQWERAD